MLERSDEPQELPVQPESWPPRQRRSRAPRRDRRGGEHLPDQLPVDSAWEDIYDPTTARPAIPGRRRGGPRPLRALRRSGRVPARLSVLADAVTRFSDRELVIATAIIDAIADSAI